MNQFERHKDPKESLGVGVFESDREFEDCEEAALWLFKNYQSLFPDKGFQIYDGKLSLPLDVYYKIHAYLRDHVRVRYMNKNPYGEDDNSRLIPDLLEDIATETYNHYKKTQDREFLFSIPINNL